jgi:hypothetical protein
MSERYDPSPKRRRRLLPAVLLGVLVIGLAFGGAAIAISRRGRGPSHPKILNQVTQAREARPFTTTPDPRFAPLPIEREKHEN